MKIHINYMQITSGLFIRNTRMYGLYENVCGMVIKVLKNRIRTMVR